MKYISLLAAIAVASTDGKKLSVDLEEQPYGDFYKGDYHGFPGTKNFAPEYDRKMPDHF